MSQERWYLPVLREAAVLVEIEALVAPHRLQRRGAMLLAGTAVALPC